MVFCVIVDRHLLLLLCCFVELHHRVMSWQQLEVRKLIVNSWISCSCVHRLRRDPWTSTHKWTHTVTCHPWTSQDGAWVQQYTYWCLQRPWSLPPSFASPSIVWQQWVELEAGIWRTRLDFERASALLDQLGCLPEKACFGVEILPKRVAPSPDL